MAKRIKMQRKMRHVRKMQMNNIAISIKTLTNKKLIRGNSNIQKNK